MIGGCAIEEIVVSCDFEDNLTIVYNGDLICIQVCSVLCIVEDACKY